MTTNDTDHQPDNIFPPFGNLKVTNAIPMKPAPLPVFLICTAIFLAGCASFNGIESETSDEPEMIERTDSVPVRSEVVAVNARLQQRGNAVIVGLLMDVKDTFERKRLYTPGKHPKNAVRRTGQSDGDDRMSGKEVVVGTETRTRGGFAKGPYVVELSIPAMDDYRDESRLSERDEQTVFELPFVERDLSVDTVISFRSDTRSPSSAMSNPTQTALSLAAGREWIFPVTIRGMGRVDPPRSQANNTQGKIGNQPDLPFEILSINPSDEGRYIVRAKVKDKSKTYGIGRLIETEAKRQMLKSYLEVNPNVPLQHIRATGKLSTEEDGAILVYTGWVFSARPVADGWKYDSESRRGALRLRISDGMPADDAKRWARENIAAIVSDKNVSIEAGKAPPPGTTYRSLGEKFEDGVLTVEFEAVQ